MELRINLAKRPYLNRRIIWRWLLLICLALLVILGINLYYGFTNYRQLERVGDRVRELDQELSELQGVDEAYSPEAAARVRQQVGIANQIIAADQFEWTALLNRLEELLPDDASIESIQPDFKTNALEITALAKQTSAMTRFLDRMLASEDFSQVYLLSQAEIEPQDQAERYLRFSFTIEKAY